MKIVWVKPGILIEEAKNGWNQRKTSGVKGFLCTNCGQLELVAVQPEAFKK